jgi:hypothetical protein
MAKELTAAELLAAIEKMAADAENGENVLEILRNKANNAKENAAAEKILPLLNTVPVLNKDKSVNEKATEKATKEMAESWQRNAFEIAQSFESAFKSERRNVGQGNKSVRVVVLDTPCGTFTMKLVQD